MWASVLNPTVLARRLWARFELLPFRYGIAAAAGVVVAAVLVTAGVMTFGGEPREHTAATPASKRHSPAEAAVPPPPTWGAYVPPRQAKPTPVPARPRVASVMPSPRRTHASPRPTSTVTCPPSLKKWPVVWEACKRKQSG